MRRAALLAACALDLSCVYVHGEMLLSGRGVRALRPDRCAVLDAGTSLMLSSSEDPVWAVLVRRAPAEVRALSVLQPPTAFALDLVDLTMRDGEVVHLAPDRCRQLAFTAEHDAFTVRVNHGPRRFYYGGRLDVDCDDPVTRQRLAGRVTFDYCASL